MSRDNCRKFRREHTWEFSGAASVVRAFAENNPVDLRVIMTPVANAADVASLRLLRLLAFEVDRSRVDAITLTGGARPVRKHVT